jgi:TrwC relaxase
VLLSALSARRAEIAADLHAHSRRTAGLRGSPSRRAREVAWAATREPKRSAPDPDDLRARWRATARDVGSSAELVVEPSRGTQRRDLDEHRFAAAIHERGQRGVARRDALSAWVGSLATGGAPGEIARCVDALSDWGTGIGVAERLLAPAAVVPAPHVLRALGPRPGSPELLDVWLGAATSIATYRAHWGVKDRWNVLGADSRAELAVMPARRLSEHLSTARAIDEALTRLGRRRERERRIDVSRALVRDGS